MRHHPSKHGVVLAAVCAATLASTLSVTTPVAAAVDSIRAASCFPKGTYFSRRFETVVKQLKREGLNVNYLGGAPAIGSPFTLVQKMTKGVYDLVSCTGAYYQNVLPEADAFKMLEHHPSVVRNNGGFEYMAKLHRAKNIEYIARIYSGTPFHLYLREGKAITKPDLAGLHLRVAPIYRNFFQALGATTQRSNIAQVYTYMENGTVDGFGWPVSGLLPDWHKVIGYRVDPGFYDADIHMLVNLDTWKKMSDEQRGILQRVGLEWENKGRDLDVAAVESARADQAKKGIKAIEFIGPDAEKWLRVAREAGWAGIIKVSPVHGPKLRGFYVK